MHINRKTTFVLILPFFLCLLACKKEKLTPLEQLPKETQEGKNTFGCLANGKVWKNGSNAILFGRPTLEAFYSKGQLSIHANKIDGKNNEYLDLYLNNGVFSPGTYRLINNSENFAMFRKQDNCEYQTDSLNTGVLEITHLDTISYIVSGRFSFTIAQPGCETLHITDGRFDVKYGN